MGILQLKRARFKSYFPAALPRRKAAGGDGCRAGLGSSAAPARFGIGHALRQNRSMPFTAGVGSADEVLKALFVDF